MNHFLLWILLFVPVASSSAQSFIDPRDSTQYPTTVIARTEWFARNLDFAMEDTEPNIPDSIACTNWGRTYSREQARHACPPGWHLPTREVWATVDTADIFALLDTVCWVKPEGHTNATGLSLQPSGFKHKKAYWNRYLSAAIWFDDPHDPESNWHLHVHGNNADFTHYLHDHKEKIKVRRFAVRCVRPAHPTH
ncbi:MAG: hypothetical protein H6592_08060 [Flavobacteriales bacterium]|nr:hypothetical protein [Flavobacteriales bacterium]HPF91232.1 FISUMP domain-containing protein [Flavobacteriales bacterium]